MYRAINQGSATGKSGKFYQFDAGQEVNATFGDIATKDVIWIGDADPEYPKHLGGPYYLLSNGEKVKGKSKAQKEQDKLCI